MWWGRGVRINVHNSRHVRSTKERGYQRADNRSGRVRSTKERSYQRVDDRSRRIRSTKERGYQRVDDRNGRKCNGQVKETATVEVIGSSRARVRVAVWEMFCTTRRGSVHVGDSVRDRESGQK